MNPVDKIAYEYAKEHGVVGLDYESIYDAVKYGYNRAIEDAWKPSEYTLSLVKKVADGKMLTGVEQMAMGTLHGQLKSL